MAYRPANPNGQATMANSEPVVIASDQSAVPVSGTFWQATQPVSLVSTTITGTVAVTQSGAWTVGVSGTVAVTLASGAAAIAKAEDDASANLDVGVPAMAVRKAAPANTSGSDGDYEMLQMSAGRLWTSATIDAALPTGANVIGAVTQSGTWNIGTVNSLTQLNGAAISMNTGVRDAGTQRVTIATNDVVPVSQSGAWSLSANQSVNVAQLAGTTTDTNSGNKSAGTLRVVLATDQPQLTNKLLVTPDANSAVNVAQMNGAAVTMNSGVVGAGVQRVVLATDVALPAGTNVIGALSANQTVDIKQLGSININLGAGATGTGTQRVTIATDTDVDTYQTVTQASGTITALDAVVGAPAGAGALVSGASTAGSLVAVEAVGGEDTFQVHIGGGSFSATIYFEGSHNSTTGTDGGWISIKAQQLGQSTTTIANGSTVTNAVWRGSMSGFKWIRARMVGATHTSSPTVILRLSRGAGNVVLTESIPAGTNIIGALSANQSVNVAQMNGVTPLMGAGNTGTGSQRVTLATDNAAIATWGHGATGAAVPANASYNGARAATANPTNATGGNTVGVMADKAGRLVVTNGHVRDLVSHQRTALAASSETTIVTAGGAGVFNDLVQLIVTTAGAAAATLTLRDGTAGTTIMIFNYPNAALAPGSPMVIDFDPPLPQAAANANWTIQNSVTTATNILARFVKNT